LVRIVPSAYHHVGIRVASIEAASDFYEAAFDARVLVAPYIVAGEVAELITGAEGARMRMSQLGFETGFVELFEFLPEELTPDAPVPYTHQGVLHFGVLVDDVPAALARVLAGGGTSVFAPRSLGDTTFCYCRDPDGNVIELADGPMDRLVALVGRRERQPSLES
jgi:catechol 2,3-dioxygenase-like lactoylglutathione lyase family enzyme